MPELEKVDNSKKGVSFGAGTASEKKSGGGSGSGGSSSGVSNSNRSTSATASTAGADDGGDVAQLLGRNSVNSYGYSRSLSFAPADVESKFILILADKVVIEDASFFETIIDQLNMSIVIVCDVSSKVESQISIDEIQNEVEIEDAIWAELPSAAPLPGDGTSNSATGNNQQVPQNPQQQTCPTSSCNECVQCSSIQSAQIKEIIKLVPKFDCVAVLDDAIRFMQSKLLNMDGATSDDDIEPQTTERESSEPAPRSKLRDLACRLAVDSNATDMTDSPFWRIF